MRSEILDVSFKMSEDIRSGSNRTDESTPPMESEQRIALKKEIGLVEGFGVILGSVIGSGIFISVRGVVSGTGSIGLCLVVWAAAGVMSAIEALCFAELGTTFRKSGSSYTYLWEAYGSLPAYLYAFNYLFPTASAIQSLTFSEYITEVVAGNCSNSQLFIKLLAIVVVLFCTILNIMSVKIAVRSGVALTIIKFSLCVVIVIGGFYSMASGGTGNLSGGFQGSEQSVGRITLSFYSALWAYSGGTLPLAIGLSSLSIIILYLLVNVSYIAVLGIDGIVSSSDAIATIWEKRVLTTSFIMSIGVAISTFGSMVSGYLSYGRMFYVAAREGHMPEVLSYVQVNYCSPIMSLMLRITTLLYSQLPGIGSLARKYALSDQTVLVIVLIAYTNIVSLINVYSLLSEFFSVMVMTGLIIMRYRRPELERPFKVPLIIPVISVFKSLFLFLVPLIDSPVWEYMYVFVFLGVGLILYVPFVYLKFEPKCMRRITIWIQILANVAPTKYNIE